MNKKVPLPDFAFQLNDKNEVTEASDTRFGYTDGNVADLHYYDNDKSEWQANTKIRYKTRRCFLSASSPGGLISFFYWIVGTERFGRYARIC